ncbi:MAG: hypothetical protein WCF67_20360 [Chitinophagaceae bacterium]
MTIETIEIVLCTAASIFIVYAVRELIDMRKENNRLLKEKKN